MIIHFWVRIVSIEEQGDDLIYLSVALIATRYKLQT